MHAHHEFDVDQPGKDSYEHRVAGASEVLAASRHGLAGGVAFRNLALLADVENGGADRFRAGCPWRNRFLCPRG
jgi:molybdopterin-guanine dinucleotide biosynthesis protein MobB